MRRVRRPWTRARSLLLAACLGPTLGCLSPSGRLGDDPATRAEADRAAAFEALADARTTDDPLERRAAVRELRTSFQVLSLRLPDDAGVRAALGALALDAGDRAAARESLARALRSDPGHVPAAVLTARLAAEDGDLGTARAVLDTALELAPTEPELWLARAQVAGLAGETEPALERLERAEELGAEAWRVAFDRSVILEFAGRAEEARDAHDRAVELAPDPALVPAR